MITYEMSFDRFKMSRRICSMRRIKDAIYSPILNKLIKNFKENTFRIKLLVEN